VTNIYFTFDIEGEYTRLTTNPKSDFKGKLWKSGLKLLKYKKYSIEPFQNLVDFFNKRKIKATFFIIGSLYSTNSLDDLGVKIQYINKNKLSNNLLELSFGKYINSIKHNKLFEFGIHSFMHENMQDRNDTQIYELLKYCRYFTNKLSIYPVSFCCPWHLYDDRVIKTLKQNNIKFVLSKDETYYYDTKSIDEIKRDLRLMLETKKDIILCSHDISQTNLSLSKFWKTDNKGTENIKRLEVMIEILSEYDNIEYKNFKEKGG